MKANPNKCYLIASCDNEMNIGVNNYNRTNNKYEKVLVIKIVHKL